MTARVVPLVARKPAWLYFVAGRLMVRADMPLAALHAQARRLGVPRRFYHRSFTAPYYKLSGAAVLRCERHMGAMAAQPELLEAALRLADRRAPPGKALDR